MRSAGRRPSFWIKLAMATGLIVLADQTLFRQTIGATMGFFALALVLAVALAHPRVRKDQRAMIALVIAAVMGLSLVEAPNPVGWLICCTALGVAVLSARARSGEGAWTWGQRLVALGFAGLLAPLRDLIKLSWICAQRGVDLHRRLTPLILPLAGGLLFLSLFAAANPVIGLTLSQFSIPEPDLPRIGFWIAALVGIWPLMRPAFLRRPVPLKETGGGRPMPGVSPASVGLSLVLFNALFALENGLDIAFLWSGAPLPPGVTLADYAHKGAYTLIFTALLAGLFVLMALRPGSATAGRPWLRRLVVLWVIQNLVLVASSALRVLDYVQVYALTALRIAALVWMGLVAVGLILICWRMIKGLSAAWLINANVLAAGVVLAACSLVDLDAVAAEWNVHHAREVGGAGEPLDLCYLQRLGVAALVPLSELEARPLNAAFRSRVDGVRSEALQTLIRQQSQWRGWSWRGQRRLDRALVLVPGAAR